MHPLRLASAVALIAVTAVGSATGPASGAPSPRPIGSPAADCRAKVAGLDLQTASVTELQAAMRSGRLTSRALTQAYLARIKAYDRPLNSIRALSPTALATADRLDRERRSGRLRGPLHGIPVLRKDNIGTTDLPTTAGSIALAGNIPVREAFVTQRLRAAGAVVLGKTNLSEFANWVALGMPNGYSSLGGQVRNAYSLGDPSGSSSGSGVAGSMAFATGTLGSETSGSILSPSSANGLVGVKPTLGLVSRAGIIPLAPSFDTAGPMTRNVTDAAALLTAIAGPDPRDAVTAGAAPVDYLAGLSGATLKGVRLGYDDGETNALFKAALADLRRLGAVLVPSDVVATAGVVGLTEIAEIPNEFKASLNTYLAEEVRPGLKSGVRSLSDVIAYNKRFPDKVKYGQNLLEASEATPGVALLGVPPAAVTRASSRAVIDAALLKDDLDAVVAAGPAYANVGAAAGYPTVIVPAGAANDGTRPNGLSFLGTAFTERQLLRYAAAYEQGTRRRVPPTAANTDLLTGC
ncbi:MAG TPA: amidase family protein [Mycobacteriales bacterium]|nr:amidase family protein [Mycobacteriales bacterium]